MKLLTISGRRGKHYQPKEILTLVLCILTSKRVLSMWFPGQNHFLMLKQLFPLSYDIKCLKTQKNKRKNHIYPQESTSFWVSTNIKDNTYTLLDPLLLQVFVQLSSLFSLFCSVSDRKSCFSINKN